MVDPGKIAGAGIGIVNSLVNAAKGIKQVRDGKKIQERLDAQGRPIVETPEAFNEVEGLVRSNYLDPRLLGETRIKDEIKARESNQIQNIQDTASSGTDALMAYNMANLNTDKSLFNVDMKAYDQQRADYSALLSTLGQKAGYQEKQFDANVMQPFIQDTEQAKALIAAGEQNRNSGFADMAGYVGSGLSGLMKNKSDTEPPKDNSTAPLKQPPPPTLYTPLYKPDSAIVNPSVNNANVNGFDVSRYNEILKILGLTKQGNTVAGGGFNF